MIITNMPKLIDSHRWKKGDLIRNKKTGKPYLTLQVVFAIGTFIVELKPETDPAIIFILTEKNYSDYVPDRDMEYNEHTHTFIHKEVKI